MKKTGKLLSVLLALVMVLSLMPMTALAADGKEAKIGDKPYDTLAEAIDAANAGDTVTLLKDVEFADTFKLDAKKAITLDLGEFTATYTGEGTYAVELGSGMDLTVKGTGTLVAPKRVIKVGSATLHGGVATEAALTINGATLQSKTLNTAGGNNDQCAVAIYANTLKDNKAPVSCSVVLKDGTVDGGFYIFGNGAKLTVSGGLIKATNSYCISGNGSEGDGNTEISITGGELKQVCSKEHTITGDDEIGAIYHPQAGTLNISGSPVISGNNGILFCSGKGVFSNISGGTITATGEDLRGSHKKGDGVINDGAALSILNRGYPGGKPQVTVSGGTFISQKSSAVLAYGWDNPNNTKVDWEDAAKFLSISGGTFSSDPAAYVTDGAAQATLVRGTEAATYLVGADAVKYAYKAGDKLTVTAGDLALTGVVSHVDVKNTGAGTVSVNGAAVAKDATVTTHNFKSEWASDETNHWHVCDVAGCTEKSDVAAHKFTDKVSKEPTCTEPGEKTLTCSVCGYEKKEAIPATGHKLTEVKEVPATELAAGVKAHYKCSACGKLFADKEGKQAVTADSLAIAKLPAVKVEGGTEVVAPEIKADAPQVEKDAVLEAHEALKQPNAVKEEGLDKVVTVEKQENGDMVVDTGDADKKVTVKKAVIDDKLTEKGWAAADTKIEAETYLQVEVKAADAKADKKGTMSTSGITFEIKPFVVLNLVKGDEKAALSSAPIASVDKPVTITLPMPESFVVPTGEKVQVVHIKDDGTKYVYDAVLKDGKITFENPNGFSTFTVQTVAATPKTGDASQIVLWSVLVIAAACGAAYVVMSNRKSRA